MNNSNQDTSTTVSSETETTGTDDGKLIENSEGPNDTTPATFDPNFDHSGEGGLALAL